MTKMFSTSCHSLRFDNLIEAEQPKAGKSSWIEINLLPFPFAFDQYPFSTVIERQHSS
jgi:hypothetical protein